MAERTRADLVAEIIKLIQPDSDRKAKCQEEIVDRILLIAKTNASTPDFSPSAAAVEAELEQLHSALTKMKSVVSQLSQVAESMVLPEGLPFVRRSTGAADINMSLRGVDRALVTQTLDIIIGRVEAASSDVKIQKKAGGRRERPWKLAAAYYAYDLIARYSPRQPSLTKDGPFFQVASLLFEATQDLYSDLYRNARARDRRSTRQSERADLTR